MNSMNTSLIIFFKQASNQATKKLTFGIDESHSGLKTLKLFHPKQSRDSSSDTVKNIRILAKKIGLELLFK